MDANDMTVIFICPHCNKYGAERSMIAIASFFKEVGITPIILLRKNGPIIELLEHKNLLYKTYSYSLCVRSDGKKKYHKALLRLGKNIFIAKKIASDFSDQCSSISYVYSNSIVSDIGVYVAKFLKVPHIQHIREFGKLDFNMEYNLGTIHGRYVFSNSKINICISNAVRTYYISKYKPCDFVCVYNGIPINEHYIHMSEMHSPWKVLVVGRISPEKGHIDVINAASLIQIERGPILDFDFWGDGSYENELKELVASRNLNGCIHFKGFSDSINYSDYDFAVVSSKAEGFGRVTVEYMAHGLAVIGANAGATPELIRQGLTGLLYEGGNANSLKECIYVLIDNPKLINQYGTNGRKIAEKHFSEEVMVKKIYNLIINNI